MMEIPVGNVTRQGRVVFAFPPPNTGKATDTHFFMDNRSRNCNCAGLFGRRNPQAFIFKRLRAAT